MASSPQAVALVADPLQATVAASGKLSPRLPALPWVDPHSVSPSHLAAYIAKLEGECLANPYSSELRTCLGIACAMNYDVYRSMDALEKAVELDPASFIAQFKYAELLYRLRILIRAEAEGIRAAERARTPLELGLAQRQLCEIRKLRREGTQKPEWNKPLLAPGLVLLAMIVVFSLAAYLHL